MILICHLSTKHPQKSPAEWLGKKAFMQENRRPWGSLSILLLRLLPLALSLAEQLNDEQQNNCTDQGDNDRAYADALVDGTHAHHR